MSCETYYYFSSIQRMARQIRAMGDLLLNCEADKIDYDKLGQFGLLIVENADSILVSYRRLSEPFKTLVGKKREAGNEEQEDMNQNFKKNQKST